MRMKIQKYADFGTSSPWFARINDINYILEPIFLFRTRPSSDDIKNAEIKKEKLNNIKFEVIKELGKAYLSLDTLKNKSKNLPQLNIENEYNNIYESLWRAYKDRSLLFIKNLDYDIGFMFKNDKDFRKDGLIFIKNNNVDDKFLDLIEEKRITWQNELSDFRNNFLDHLKTDKSLQYQHFYTIKNVELVFDHVWKSIEDIWIILIKSYYPLNFDLREIPKDKRDKNNPIKFEIINI